MAIANSLAFLLYLSASAILIRNFVHRDQKSSNSLPAGILIVLALVFHASDIFFTMKLAGGWDVSLFTTLSIAAWLMAFIAFTLGIKTPNNYLGMVVYPLVALSLIFKASMPNTHATVLVNPALEWHILQSLAAYSLFTLAALQAILLAIQEQQLRQRHIAGLMRKLPPLQSMETGLFQLIIAGFILFSAGLLTGVLFVDNIFDQRIAHKTILSLVAWCVFATLLWGRWRYGWRGKTAIKWTLIGFTLLVLAFLGSKFVLEFILVDV